MPATRPKNGKGVGFFSLEMAKEQLASRVLAGESGIPADWVRRADLNQSTSWHSGDQCLPHRRVMPALGRLGELGRARSGIQPASFGVRMGGSGGSAFTLALTRDTRPDPRDPRPNSKMIGRDENFRYHNCARCDSGKRLCVRGDPRNCDWLHARTDQHGHHLIATGGFARK